MKKLWSLGLVMVLAGGLYLWKLNRVPSAVYVDEATVGYNAWSMLHTGRDEYGQAMPILFKFFGAYTPGLAVYLAVPVVKLLGLNAFAIRLPAVLFGLITIVVVYGISKKIWGAVFYAILPWVVFNSRLGYEVMLGQMLYAIGMYFGLKAVRRSELQVWSIFVLSLSTYATHVQRYLLPFLLIFLGWYWGVKHISRKAILVLVLMQLPNIYLALTPSGFWVKNDAISKSPAVVWENFSRQYLTYLSPGTIFESNPDIDLQHQIPGLALVYWWMIVPAAIGWVRSTKQIKILLLVSIIPAAFSGVFISTQRALPMLLPLGVLIALGMGKNRFVNIGLVTYSLVLLWRGYFVLMPTLNATAWNWGYEQLAKIRRENPNETWVVDNVRNPRAYMLFYFYNKNIDSLEFAGINWKKDECREVVLVGDPLAISDNQTVEHKLRKAFEIKDPMEKVVVSGYRTNPEEKCGKIGV